MKDILKIAIQGGQASFHDMAARHYFSDCDIAVQECRTFRQMCKQLIERKVERAVMAVENTLVGSILPNYSLLQEYPLHIIGEAYLHIKHYLMALPGQSIPDIRYVHSHPMALLQCSEFLENYPKIIGIETFDTAESAREIREKQLKGVAAIAGKLAATKYSLDILAEDIENLMHNYTRFLILSQQGMEQDSSGADKASISFHISHEVGSLAQVLNVFAENSVNLSVIQSIAIPERPHEYAFHVDVEWQNRASFDIALEQVKPLSKDLKLLGIYKSGEKPSHGLI